MNGIEVKVKNGNLEKALRKFKRKIKDSGLMLEIRKNEEYTKPSKIRREKKLKAKLRARLTTKRNNT